MNWRFAAIAAAIALCACGNSTPLSVGTEGRTGTEQLERLSTAGALEPVKVDADTVSMDLPIDVIVVGFPRDAAAQLATALEPLKMDQFAASYPRVLGSPSFNPGHVALRAVFQVTYAPQSLADGYRAALAAGSDPRYRDGNAAEAWLTHALADAGFTADPARPAVVMLHQGSQSAGYSYDYGNGTLAPVRVFGAGNLAILDLGAEADPFVGDSDPAYAAPLALDDADLVDKLKAAAVDTTAFRLAQGPIYLPSMKSCHALTVIAARRATATDGWPGYPLDAEQLRSTFERLTGDLVYVDVKELTLPQDDPALDVVTRVLNDTPTGVTAAGVRVQLPLDPDVLTREWVEANWSTYHVPHEGCEEYLTLVVSGDQADIQGRCTAEYADGGSHRFAYAMATSLCPLLLSLPVDPPIGNCLSRDGIRDYRLPNMLVTHETGHLFGLRHPHDISYSAANFAFSSLATSMSYELDDRMLGFGAIDDNNLKRNRAATALWMAHRAGHSGEPVLATAVQAMQEYRWDDVTHLLRGLDLTPLPQPPRPKFCQPLPPGTTVETLEPATPCPLCTASDEPLAVDGDLTTFAVMHSTPARGGGVLRATLPSGVVMPSGTAAGVFFTRSVWAALDLFIRTYLDGELQDQDHVAGGGGTAGEGYYDVQATRPFNAIEIDATYVPGIGDLNIEEFCADGSIGTK